LLAAFSDGGLAPKIVKVTGTIDMTEGQPFTSHADQVVRAAIKVPANTTLIGAQAGAGFINGYVQISGVSQVIVRNLKIVAPCDVTPVWDPTDGALGNWNSAFDAISIAGADHVWIDHNTVTDAPVTDDTLPVENGKTKQCHDGSLDITNGADYITVSYNVFEKHDKAMLIGSSDSSTSDPGRLRITFSNNVFSDITQRAPRVRFGQVHLFNNYHVGSKAATVYAHSYSVGVGKSGQIRSNNNVFAVTGAAGCDSVVTTHFCRCCQRLCRYGLYAERRGAGRVQCGFQRQLDHSLCVRAAPCGTGEGQCAGAGWCGQAQHHHQRQWQRGRCAWHAGACQGRGHGLPRHQSFHCLRHRAAGW